MVAEYLLIQLIHLANIKEIKDGYFNCLFLLSKKDEVLQLTTLLLKATE